jgi:hypothetical protein
MKHTLASGRFTQQWPQPATEKVLNNRGLTVGKETYPEEEHEDERRKTSS